VQQSKGSAGEESDKYIKNPWNRNKRQKKIEKKKYQE
jgi:hypothetical protein